MAPDDDIYDLVFAWQDHLCEPLEEIRKWSDNIKNGCEALGLSPDVVSRVKAAADSLSSFAYDADEQVSELYEVLLTHGIDSSEYSRLVYYLEECPRQEIEVLQGAYDHFRKFATQSTRITLLIENLRSSIPGLNAAYRDLRNRIGEANRCSYSILPPGCDMDDD